MGEDEQTISMYHGQKKAFKMENKLVLLISGLQEKNIALSSNLNQSVNEFQEIHEHLTSLKILKQNEIKDLSASLNLIENLKLTQEVRTNKLQHKYLSLLKIKENLDQDS